MTTSSSSKFYVCSAVPHTHTHTYVCSKSSHSLTHTHPRARAHSFPQHFSSHTFFHAQFSQTVLELFHPAPSPLSMLRFPAHYIFCFTFDIFLYIFFTRNIVTPIFHTHLCHTRSFTHNFNTYNSSHATFSLIDHPPPPLSILPCPSLWNFIFLLIVQLRTPAMPVGLGAFVAAKLKTLCWQHKFEPGWYSREAEGPEQRR